LIKEESEAKHYCPNQYGCPTQIKARFLHFCCRKAMDIIAGEATIDQLYNKGYIKVLSDIYRLTVEQLLSLDGWKERSADRFLKSVEKSKSVPFSRVLYALGIRYVGETTAKNLASHFLSIDNIISASREELLEVEEVGDKLADSIISFFSVPVNLQLINDFKHIGLKLEEKTENKTVSTKLSGLNIVISGVFPISREEMKSLIESHSGKAANTVTPNTSYLLVGENPGSSKLQKAKQLGIPMITEKELREMIG